MTRRLFDDPTLAIEDWVLDFCSANGGRGGQALTRRDVRADLLAQARAEESRVQLPRLLDAIEACRSLPLNAWTPAWKAAARGARLDAGDAPGGATALELVCAATDCRPDSRREALRTLIALRALRADARSEPAPSEQELAENIAKARAWARGGESANAAPMTNAQRARAKEEAGRQLAQALAIGSSGVAEALVESFPEGFEPADAGRALRHAAATGSLDWTRQLLALGADPRSADGSGRTAADVASRKGHAEIADALREAIAQGNANAAACVPFPSGLATRAAETMAKQSPGGVGVLTA